MNSPIRTDRRRLRFEEARREESQDGHDTIVVCLEWAGERHSGEAKGVHTREGELRTSAAATLIATRAILGDDAPNLDLLGIKAVRAFDGWVVIASVALTPDDGGDTVRLLGARTSEDGDLIRAAAVATLDALNRVLERYL